MYEHTMQNKAFSKRIAIVVTTLIAAAAVAGCAHPPDDEEGGGQQDGSFEGADDDSFKPQPDQPSANAVLSTESQEGWLGETFTFDGSDSTAEEGEVTTWRFEFGDDETLEVTAPEEAVVEHTYSSAGTYTVNLTVEAQAIDGNSTEDGITDTTSLQVTVHDRIEIPETGLSSGLLGDGERENHTLPVHEGAVNLSVNLAIEGEGFLDNDGTVQVLGPDGAVVAEESFNLSSGEQAEISLEAEFNVTGDHFLEVELSDGEVTYEGSVEIYYGLAGEADSQF